MASRYVARHDVNFCQSFAASLIQPSIFSVCFVLKKCWFLSWLWQHEEFERLRTPSETEHKNYLKNLFPSSRLHSAQQGQIIVEKVGIRVVVPWSHDTSDTYDTWLTCVTKKCVWLHFGCVEVICCFHLFSVVLLMFCWELELAGVVRSVNPLNDLSPRQRYQHTHSKTMDHEHKKRQFKQE